MSPGSGPDVAAVSAGIMALRSSVEDLRADAGLGTINSSWLTWERVVMPRPGW